jgi:hypothetical protein
MTDWRNGGYFLMGPVKDGAVTDRRLPPVLWSISTCVADSYPDESYLSWIAPTSSRDVELREVLGLSTEELFELKRYVTELFNASLVRWPNVFASLNTARDFHGRWLTAVPGVRLLGISMRASGVPAFLAETASASNPSDGVGSLLSEDRMCHEGNAWGFEVLGSDFGTFHTYLCHGLETELMDVLAVRFNEHGLISEWSDAERASEWLNRDETGAEPVPWFAWRIDEYAVE